MQGSVLNRSVLLGVYIFITVLYYLSFLVEVSFISTVLLLNASLKLGGKELLHVTGRSAKVSSLQTL